MSKTKEERRAILDKLKKKLDGIGLDPENIAPWPEPKLEIEQIEMPDDWVRQVSEAKVQHDKHGNVALVIVLPLAWLEDFKSKVQSQDPGIVKHIRRNMLWGADIKFGPVDKPIAAGEWIW